MASNELVTIEKSYYDTLLHRASANVGFSRSNDDPHTITIARSLHSELLKQCREYQYLRQALLAGGVTPEALSTLISPAEDFVKSTFPSSQQYDHTVRRTMPKAISGKSSDDDYKQKLSEKLNEISRFRLSQPMTATFASDNGPKTTALPLQVQRKDSVQSPLVARPSVKRSGHAPEIVRASRSELEDDLGSLCEPLMASPNINGSWRAKPDQQHREIRQDHTLLFSSLPDDVTHKDLTGIIKGGRLIEIWLREKEHTAAVTFAEGAAAFLAYSKRNPLYIRGLRVEVTWSGYQLSPHKAMLNRLATNQSRNLVIRNALNRIAAEEVVEHIDHIHQLKVVQYLWQGHDLYLSTNSIAGASLARLCLLSRQKYKNIVIEFYPDQCAEPLPQPDAVKPRSPQKRASEVRGDSAREAWRLAPMHQNRFDTLSLIDNSSDVELSMEDDSDSTCSDIQLRPRSTASEDST